ncbi:response regulator [Aerosakkonema funiforme]|uniref:response regulator n=1 Tax=Aerosakkonema funiforme TaxID=1246630 RepID=UPI0035B9B4D6
MTQFNSQDFLILVVDDISQNLQVIGEMLENAGYDTTFATSGQQALERVQTAQPDLILLDLMMPGMNGLQVCQKLKADPKLCEIPIIFLTASNEKEDLLQAFKLGAADYITKPFQPEEVLARIEVRLANQRLKKELEERNQQLQIEIEVRIATEEALKKTVESLHTTSRQLAEAQRIAHLGSWSRDIFTNKLTWSKETFRIFGFAPDRSEPSHTELNELIYPDDIELFQTTIARAIADGLAYQFEFRIKRSDGQLRYIETTGEPIFNSAGQVIRLFGTVLDISDRKQAEIALRQSEQKFRKAFDHTAVGMCLVSPTGKFMQVNSSLCQMLGYSKQELLSFNFEEITYPDDINIDWKSQENLLNGEIILYHIEKRYLHKNTSIVWGLLSVSLVRDNREQPLYFVTQIQDITALKNTAAELLLAKEAAVTASQAKSVFLANMSHELRTPLNAILGFAQLLIRDSNLNEKQRENIGIIGRSGEHLLNLINDILDISKIEAGHMELNQTEFDLKEMLWEIEEMFLLKADSKCLELKFDFAADVPQFIRSDRLKLRQVLINLLSNAIKFTNKGTVTMQVKLDSSSPSIANTSRILFVVDDTGVGIDPEEINSIFNPFVQTQAGIVSGQGTGLGLAISRKYVQLLGGDIKVNSQIGKGTTFQFDIQATAIEKTFIEPQQNNRRVIALAPNQPRYRILVVDDKESNRQLLVQLLLGMDFEVRQAINGKDAIQVWENFQPHLIWMDMRMPVMDGYEATKEIKAKAQQKWAGEESGSAGKRENKSAAENLHNASPTSQSPATKTIIIALTASVFKEQKPIMLSAGCDDIVCKPIQESVIFEKLAEHLGVEFVYEEDQISTQANSYQSINISALKTLPHAWLEQLEEASLTLEEETIYNLIEQIESQETALAHALRTYAENFEYQKIVSAIAAAKSSNFSQPEGSNSADQINNQPSQAKISREWVANMKQAIDIADLDAMNALVNILRNENIVMAQLIQYYLTKLDYEKIINLIVDN